MRHPLPLYVVLLLAGIYPTACGASDADAGVARYIDSVSPAFEQARAAREALDEEVSPPGAASDVADAKRWFDQAIEIELEFVGSLRAVADPPAQLRQAHSDYLVAGTELLVLDRFVRDRLADAGPDFDMAQLANDRVIGLAQQNRLEERAKEACKKLETRVREAGATADLSCESIR